MDYDGCVEQAVRDLIDWVEEGTAPPPSTGYDYFDSGVHPYADADAHGGIQPLVVATANGGERATVRAGDTVEFEARISVPNQTGYVIAASWDFDGTGAYPVSHPELDGTESSVVVSTSHTFDSPGTYFPAVLATSQRQGDTTTEHYRLNNLGRVRVVVE